MKRREPKRESSKTLENGNNSPNLSNFNKSHMCEGEELDLVNQKQKNIEHELMKMKEESGTVFNELIAKYQNNNSVVSSGNKKKENYESNSNRKTKWEVSRQSKLLLKNGVESRSSSKNASNRQIEEIFETVDERYHKFLRESLSPPRHKSNQISSRNKSSKSAKSNKSIKSEISFSCFPQGEKAERAFDLKMHPFYQKVNPAYRHLVRNNNTNLNKLSFNSASSFHFESKEALSIATEGNRDDVQAIPKHFIPTHSHPPNQIVVKAFMLNHEEEKRIQQVSDSQKGGSGKEENILSPSGLIPRPPEETGESDTLVTLVELDQQNTEKSVHENSDKESVSTLLLSNNYPDITDTVKKDIDHNQNQNQFSSIHDINQFQFSNETNIFDKKKETKAKLHVNRVSFLPESNEVSQYELQSEDEIRKNIPSIVNKSQPKQLQNLYIKPNFIMEQLKKHNKDETEALKNLITEQIQKYAVLIFYFVDYSAFMQN